jgi:hypothetical protein
MTNNTQPELEFREKSPDGKILPEYHRCRRAPFHHGFFFTDISAAGALNFAARCAPSQKGLFFD